MAIIVGISLMLPTSSQNVYAATQANDYPWQYAQPTGRLSDWYIDENSNGRYDGDSESHDPFGFSYRNCTSYVAWRLSEAGFTIPYGSRLGHARTWARNAFNMGYRVDSTPAPGAVAVWSNGLYGHVAFVETVAEDGTISISEYNTRPVYGGMYGQRQGIKAPHYIHFLTVAPQKPAVQVVAQPAARSGIERNLTSDNLGVQEKNTTVVKDESNSLLTPNLKGSRFALADIDSDGIDEIVTIGVEQDGTTSLYWQTDAGYGTARTGLDSKDIEWLGGDVTGDGTDDIVAIKTLNGQLKIYVWPAYEQGLSQGQEWFNAEVQTKTGHFVLAERTGDTKLDLVFVPIEDDEARMDLLWFDSTGKRFKGV